MPDLKKINEQDENHTNTAPLFYWDENKNVLLRRVDIKDPYNYEWTEDWTGWATLMQLIRERGILRNIDTQLLSDPDTQLQAIMSGLITDSELLNWFFTLKKDAIRRPAT